MRNLKLSVKVGLLVAVLLGTVVVVAGVGVVQLSHLNDRFDHLANTTSKAAYATGDGAIALLSAIRSEKNAILVEDKTAALEHAEESRKSVARLREAVLQLEQLAGVDVSTPEGKATAELGRAVDEFEQSNKELLRIAVLKSVTEGERIVRDELYKQLRELEELAGALAQRGEGAAASGPAPGAGAVPAQAAARAAVGRYHELLFLLTLHLGSLDEQEMSRLDVEIRQSLLSLQESLRKLSAVLDEADRASSGAALGSIDQIKNRVALVQQLSRTNSDNVARDHSMSKGVEAGDRCSALLADVRKALRTRVSEEVDSVSMAATVGRSVVITTAVLGALISLALAFVVIRSITKPVAHGVKVFEAIAAGDLTRRMELDQRDEIGRLGTASDRMAAALCEVVTRIRAVAGRLGSSAGELSKVSNDLVSQSHEMSTQAESVAAGTEEMSTTVATMAAAAEQMSVNVSSISSASEEVSVNVGSIVRSADATSRSVGSVAESIAQITTSLRDVARDAKHGSQITQQAKSLAAGATGTMRQLDQAASEITKVTEVIKSIALQTNLLALNATIEATSAGEAGKGFAVVASEVKELASQSAHSAEDIALKIESVQASTRQAVKVIEDVAKFVEQVNESAGRISDAVDGQTETAGQIVAAVGEARQGVESIARSIAEVGKGATDVSRNTSEAAHAATDVSRNASEAAKAAETISSNIHGVSEATRLSSASAARLNDAAKQLDELASDLQRVVSRFRVEASG